MILEAGALAIPVIASRVDGIPEVINDGHLGVLVHPPIRRLEVAVRSLLGDGDRRAMLGAALHGHVAANFSWDRAWAQYTALVD